MLFNLLTERDKKQDNGIIYKYLGILDIELSTIKNNLNFLKKNFYSSNELELNTLIQLENTLGTPYVSDNLVYRKNIVKYFIDIIKNKGNLLSYKYILRCIDITLVSLEKIDSAYNYKLLIDSNSQERLDSNKILEIVKACNFVEPMYVGIYSIKDQNNVEYDLFTFYINNLGDLYYDNYLGIKLELINGDLFINSENYYINVNGDLIKL